MPEDQNTDDSIFDVVDSYNDKLSEKYPEKYLKLRKLGLFLANVGLSLEEACLMAQLDARWVAAEMEAEPALMAFVRMKTLVYKAKLLRIVSTRAFESKDEGVAKFLLEQRYPGEFKQRTPGGRPSSPATPSTDSTMLDAVRAEGDSAPIIPDLALEAIHTDEPSATGMNGLV